MAKPKTRKTMMQRMADRVVVYTNRHPYIGPVFWILSVQYMIVQVIVAAAWPVMYSWKENYISDLGNTECGLYDALYVCSPLHLLMNVSFIVFGITMALGSILIYSQFKRTKLSLIGFSLMSLSGFGTMMVGLFPENEINSLHMIGAILGLGVGNVSVLVLGLALKDMRWGFRVYTTLTAIVCLTAFGLFIAEIYLGLGRGGMERLISYPFVLWMFLFGLYMSAVRYRARHYKIS